jgi:hypothetical protein
VSAPAPLDPVAVRRAEQASLDADVRAVLDNPDGAGRAYGRLLARFGVTASGQREALRDILSAAQRELTRSFFGKGA